MDSLDLFVDSLRDALERIGRARERADSFHADVVVAATSRPLGFLLELGATQLAALASAGCGVVIDMYSSDETEDDESGA